MPNTKGSNRGGIRTLDDLRQRCVIEGECWIWRGACNRCSGPHPEPRFWLPAQSRVVGVSGAWLLAGKKLPRGYVVWRVCREPMCLNPEHMRSGTQADRGAWYAQRGLFRGDPHRSLTNAVAARRRSVLTAEQVQQIRESKDTGRALSLLLGVSESVVSRARRGDTHRTAAPSSVFTWRP